jgi:hypothetical protein
MKIKFTDESISIHQNNNAEIVYWHIDEWKDNPEIVFSIANAIKLALTNPNKLLKLIK